MVIGEFPNVVPRQDFCYCDAGTVQHLRRLLSRDFFLAATKVDEPVADPLGLKQIDLRMYQRTLAEGDTSASVVSHAINRTCGKHIDCTCKHVPTWYQVHFIYASYALTFDQFLVHAEMRYEFRA